MKNFLKLAGGLGLLGALLLLEHRRPLRVEKESKLRRVQRNLAVAALAAITIHFVESPVITPLAELVKKKHWGLLKQRRLPRIVETLATLALLDYTVYLQHVLHHRVPLLWRFHAVHHVDLDLDASTALRFHFGEIALSVPYRVAQVLLIGVDPKSLMVWQTFLLLSIMFHHSNLRIAKAIEDRLVRIIVTPRMHGIHHSNTPEHQNSNWSGGFTIWDAIHGTLNVEVTPEQVEIGVRGFDRPAQVTLPKILMQPFRDEPAIRAFLESASSASTNSVRAQNKPEATPE
jgi:sterol desaturase/sphingolipid hydroxylase (fatty acid hydroxylase superfamily)